MNTLIVVMITFPLTLLVIYLAYQMEENFLLKSIYKRLLVIKRVPLTNIPLSASKKYMRNRILGLLMELSMQKSLQIHNPKDMDYEQMEVLLDGYVNKKGIRLIDSKISTGYSKLAVLKRMNRTLEKIIGLKRII